MVIGWIEMLLGGCGGSATDEKELVALSGIGNYPLSQ